MAAPVAVTVAFCQVLPPLKLTWTAAEVTAACDPVPLYEA